MNDQQLAVLQDEQIGLVGIGAMTRMIRLIGCRCSSRRGIPVVMGGRT
jgi:hypothetical protein